MTGTAMQIIQWLTKQKDGQVWEIKKHMKKRTLSQNNYYWQLCGQIADALRHPKEQVHNEMLRSYGQVDRIAGRLITVPIPDTEKAEQEVLRSMKYHLKPTSQVRSGAEGVLYRTYVMLKGSHDMDTEEMSILVDGIVQEAQQLGIETLTPAELEAMRAYEEHHKRK